jgi:hypothetical protein
MSAVFLVAFLTFSCAGPVGEARQNWPLNEKLPESLAVINMGGAEGVILPVSHAPTTLTQCSRRTLGPGEGYWQPTIEDLRPLERHLSAFVRDNPNSMYPNQWQELSKFKRQYAGIIRNDKKTIYVNLFPSKETVTAWRRQVILVCDGGPWYFGVEYDIEAAKFTHIAYNGLA